MTGKIKLKWVRSRIEARLVPLRDPIILKFSLMKCCFHFIKFSSFTLQFSCKMNFPTTRLQSNYVINYSNFHLMKLQKNEYKQSIKSNWYRYKSLLPFYTWIHWRHTALINLETFISLDGYLLHVWPAWVRKMENF